MIHKLRVFYKHYKITIITVIGITAFIIAVIHIINNNIKNSKIDNTSISESSNSSISNTAFTTDSTQVTGEEKPEIIIQRANENISRFLDFCIHNNSEEAYKLLKEKDSFENINSFNNYINSNKQSLETDSKNGFKSCIVERNEKYTQYRIDYDIDSFYMDDRDESKQYFESQVSESILICSTTPA